MLLSLEYDDNEAKLKNMTCKTNYNWKNASYNWKNACLQKATAFALYYYT